MRCKISVFQIEDLKFYEESYVLKSSKVLFALFRDESV